MYKDTTYKEKFTILKEWIPSIINEIKKDLKNDHLKKDIYFVKKFLPGKNINKITNEDLIDAYKEAVAQEEKGEEIAEFIASRWLLKNTDLYDFFEKQLTLINPNFTDLDLLSHEEAKAMIHKSQEHYGYANTYLFSVLNSVVFPKEIFDFLEKQAHSTRHEQEVKDKVDQENKSIDSLKQEFALNLARMEDKYEKKLSGLQKKYHTDTESLKKQIGVLQKKLHSQQ